MSIVRNFAAFSFAPFHPYRNTSNNSNWQLPHNLAYKIHVVARASDFWALWDWSYRKGGLIAQIGSEYRNWQPYYPFLSYMHRFASCARLQLFVCSLLGKMAKPGRKPKSFIAPRYNPYAYRIRASQAFAAPVFQDVSTNYLEIAKGEDVESDGGDSDYLNETRRRS
jgi:hypothetical protein